MDIDCTFSDSDDEKELELHFPSREEFLASVQPQCFSLPDPIMDYVIKNVPTSDLYEKLIRSCKYFYAKNPIFLLRNVSGNNKNEWEEVLIHRHGKSSPSHDIGIIDRNVINEKVWMAKIFEFVGCCYGLDDVPTNIPRILMFSAQEVRLYSVNISMDELKYLTRGAKEVSLDYLHVRNDSDEYYGLEEIVEVFSGIDSFTMYSRDNDFAHGVKNYKKMAEICGTIKNVNLHRMPSNFKVEKFYNQLFNTKNRSLIHISVYHDRDGSYGNVIDRIGKCQVFTFVPPVIYIHGRGAHMVQLKKIRDKVASTFV